LLVPPVRIQPPQEAAIFATDLGNPRRDAAASGERRREPHDGDVVFRVVESGDKGAPRDLQIHMQGVAGRSREHTRFDDVLLRRGRAGIEQACDHRVNCDAANHDRTDPVVDGAACDMDDLAMQIGRIRPLASRSVHPNLGRLHVRVPGGDRIGTWPGGRRRNRRAQHCRRGDGAGEVACD
jgi:hypothetical protein